MANDKQTVISEFAAYVESRGGTYSGWYVGVATSATQRLFNDHAVREHGDGWIYQLCASSSDARAVEKYFLTQGMKGGPGGGDQDSRYVYAYKIAPHTVES